MPGHSHQDVPAEFLFPSAFWEVWSVWSTGRYAFQLWKPLGQVFSETVKKMPTSVSNSFTMSTLAIQLPLYQFTPETLIPSGMISSTSSLLTCSRASGVSYLSPMYDFKVRRISYMKIDSNTAGDYWQSDLSSASVPSDILSVLQRRLWAEDVQTRGQPYSRHQVQERCISYPLT